MTTNETHAIAWGRDYQPIAGWPNGGIWLVGAASISNGWRVAMNTVAQFLTDDFNEDAIPGTGASIYRLDGCEDREINVVLLAPDDEREWPWVLQTPHGRFGTNDATMAATLVDYATERDNWGYDEHGNAAGE